MKVVVAMDKFRGTLSAVQACEAVAVGVRQAGYDVISVPMSDGGEGFLGAFGGANRHTTVTGPQGVPVKAGWRMDGRRAVIESAAASGLALMSGSGPRDPVAATSRGVGELIDAALSAGARDIWVGVGGTGCTDGGAGAIDALERWLPDLPASLSILVDVTTRFADAARVFGPQKGASPADVEVLTARLQRLSDSFLARFGRAIGSLPGAGAGGGLAGGLAAIGGTIRSGFDAIADATGLETHAAAADLVVTGEGRFDAPSLAGKVVGGVLGLAASHGVPALVVAGDVDPATSVSGAVPADVTVRSLTAEVGAERAWHDTAAALTELTRGHLGSLRRPGS